jgi:beta-lactam-binding protein with PASTA domain
MPDLVGMSRADAVATLEAAGLSNIRVKEKAGPGCQTDKICGTSPAAGKKAYPQVVQTLYVGGMNTTTD